jgi:osmotically-inducible protein OsmY
MGVSNIYNAIGIKQQSSASEVKERISEALKRQATADAKSIQVETMGGKVTLTGHASSFQSIEDASSAAWAAPGVTEVVDNLYVSL